jgi:hypothetical protein
MLSRKQLEDMAKSCEDRNNCKGCLWDDDARCGNKHGIRKAVEQAAQTALAYRVMLAKILQVMEGFDYRANIKFTMSDCIGVETDAKALLKGSEG